MLPTTCTNDVQSLSSVSDGMVWHTSTDLRDYVVLMHSSTTHELDFSHDVLNNYQRIQRTHVQGKYTKFAGERRIDGDQIGACEACCA